MKVRRIANEYEAVRWNGDNFEEVEKVIQKYIPADSGPYRDDEEYLPGAPHHQYDMLRWWCCEDHELDRDCWAVFEVGYQNSHFHAIMDDKSYWREFERAEA